MAANHDEKCKYAYADKSILKSDITEELNV